MLVSVIMATYNNEREIGLAISSILLQKYEKLELIVVNDGSTDITPEIVEVFSYEDSRVKVLHNRRNCGRAASRNRAVKAAQGDLIAIMDADDIAMPGRLAKQVEYLTANPEVGMLGTWGYKIDASNNLVGVISTLTDDSDLRRQLSWARMPFIHTSMMFRRSLMVSAGLYDSRFIRAQDLHLCRRAIERTRAGCLPEFLLLYRTNPTRSKYQWGARAARDILIHYPNMIGYVYLAFLSLMSILPERVVGQIDKIIHSDTTQSNIKDKSEINLWIKKLEQFSSFVYT